jgi:hypothetical protein
MSSKVLNSLPDIVQVIKPRRMIMVVYVAHVREVRRL